MSFTIDADTLTAVKADITEINTSIASIADGKHENVVNALGALIRTSQAIIQRISPPSTFSVTMTFNGYDRFDEGFVFPVDVTIILRRDDMRWSAITEDVYVRECVRYGTNVMQQRFKWTVGGYEFEVEIDLGTIMLTTETLRRSWARHLTSGNTKSCDKVAIVAW